MLLALLSTLAVAGDEVLVVAFPGGTETAALVDAARTWPLAVREVGGWADAELTSPENANYLANLATVYAAQVEVVREAIDRSRERADFTEKAAAMAGFYTAVLALKFSVEGESPDRLPLRGVLLVAFLGLAIAFSAVYLAFITKGATVEGPKPKGNLRDDQREELNAFVRWCAAMVLRRREFMQAAVLGLAPGVAFLPVAFLEIDDMTAFPAAGVAILVSVIFVAFIAWGSGGSKAGILGCARCRKDEAGVAIDRPGFKPNRLRGCPRFAVPPPPPG
jgi:hypothetical protein